jgi:hypothetical protein
MYADTVIAGLIGVAPGCYQVGQPGSANTSCNQYDFINPITQQPVYFPGCCRPNGKCGYLADLTAVAQGPNLGCVPADCSGGGVEQNCTP